MTVVDMLSDAVASLPVRVGTSDSKQTAVETAMAAAAEDKTNSEAPLPVAATAGDASAVAATAPTDRPPKSEYAEFGKGLRKLFPLADGYRNMNHGKHVVSTACRRS